MPEMIKKIWHKLVTSKSNGIKPVTQIVGRSEHNISRKDISPNALKVLSRLNEAGFQAYLVGGGVRDILLGLSPKDFDIATDATPDQISKLFRNSRIIGRRFRLAHILFGREVIEVATFRAGHEDSCDTKAKTGAHGMLVRDNVFGNLEEDAFRRDFTVNALYYTSTDFSLLDHVAGLDDLDKRQLRLIGDPVTRYREDPVRILRAIRLSCKLDLSIEQNTAAPIKSLAEMLTHISSARLWEESNKLFLAGHAFKTWHKLIELEVAQHIFPLTTKALSQDSEGKFAAFIDQALQSTDNRIANQQPVTPAFLFAVFLWQPMQTETENLMAKGLNIFEASQKATRKTFEIQRKTIAIPKRFSLTAGDIWNLQHRLFNLKPRNVNSLIVHPKFRAAYDFLCLRAGDDAKLKHLADWWTEYQAVSPQARSEMVSKAAKKMSPPKKKRRKRAPGLTKSKSARKPD